jgi:hypothetical protein
LSLVHPPLNLNICSVPCRYASTASGATLVKAMDTKNTTRNICRELSDVSKFLSSNIKTHSVFALIEPIHKREYVASNTSQKATNKENLADMRITSETIIDNSSDSR